MAGIAAVAEVGERSAEPRAPVVKPVKPARVVRANTGEPSARAIIPLANNRDLRARQRLFAEAVAAAERNLAAAEARLRSHARAIAGAPTPPNLGGFEAGRLTREVEDARSELAVQREALASIDEQLAAYGLPERKSAAAAQRQRFGVALDEHYAALDALEQLVKGRLVSALREVVDSRKRAAAELGAETLGVLGDMTGDDGLKRRLSQLIAGPLIGLLDGQTLSFYLGNSISHDRKWSECERTHLGSVDLGALE